MTEFEIVTLGLSIVAFIVSWLALYFAFEVDRRSRRQVDNIAVSFGARRGRGA